MHRAIKTISIAVLVTFIFQISAMDNDLIRHTNMPKAAAKQPGKVPVIVAKQANTVPEIGLEQQKEFIMTFLKANQTEDNKSQKAIKNVMISPMMLKFYGVFSRGDEAGLKALLDQNIAEEFRDLPLKLAVACYHINQLTLIELLLDRGASVKDHLNPLAFLAFNRGSNGHCEAIIKMLLARGADVNGFFKDGYYINNPLRFMLECHRYYLANILIEKKALVDAPLKGGNTPLFICAAIGRLEGAEFLVNLGANVNHRNARGKTALCYVARQGNNPLRLAQTLLDSGAKADNKDAKGRTVFHTILKDFAHGFPTAETARVAAFENLLDLLIKRGVSLRERSADGTFAWQSFFEVKGKEPFLLQRSEARLGMAEILISRAGITAAEIQQVYKESIVDSDFELIELFMRHPKLYEGGVGIEKWCSTQGYTPLHYAAVHDLLDLAFWLQADVNARGLNGCTPLHIAALCRSYRVAKFLIESRADVTIANNYGQTAHTFTNCFQPADFLIMASNQEIFELNKQEQEFIQARIRRESDARDIRDLIDLTSRGF